MLNKNFGAVVNPLKIENLYWDSNWDAHNPDITSEQLDDMTVSEVGHGYFSKLAQYGVTSATFLGSHQADPSCRQNAGSFIKFTDLSDFVLCEKHVFNIAPLGDQSVVYVVYAPESSQWCTLAIGPVCITGGCPGWIGFHWDTLPSISPGDAEQIFAFDLTGCAAADQPTPADSITDTATHETVEAAVDPFLDDWIDSDWVALPDVKVFVPLIAGEAADLCETGIGSPAPPPATTVDSRVRGSLFGPSGGVMTYAVAYYWSNADGACVPPPLSITVSSISGLPSGGSVFIDGVQYLAFPTPAITVASGSYHTISFPTVVLDPADPAGTRYVTSSPNFVGYVTGDINLAISYQKQYLAQFAETGIPTGVNWSINVGGSNRSGPFSGWFNAGSSIPFAYQSPVTGSAGTRYTLTAVTMPSGFAILGPVLVSATYQTARLLTISTSGLSTNQTNLSNTSIVLGTASDNAPLAVWLPNGTPLALTADAVVNGSGGSQFFFQGFVPAPPTTLNGPFATTATYTTIPILINSGEIDNQGIASSLRNKVMKTELDISAGNYRAALSELRAFIQSVRAQAGKHVSSSAASTLSQDALSLYHDSICKALAGGQIGPAQADRDYDFYVREIHLFGGTAKPACRTGLN